jgi:hypothetical protein
MKFRFFMLIVFVLSLFSFSKTAEARKHWRTNHRTDYRYNRYWQRKRLHYGSNGFTFDSKTGKFYRSKPQPKNDVDSEWWHNRGKPQNDINSDWWNNNGKPSRDAVINDPHKNKRNKKDVNSDWWHNQGRPTGVDLGRWGHNGSRPSKGSTSSGWSYRHNGKTYSTTPKQNSSFGSSSSSFTNKYGGTNTLNSWGGKTSDSNSGSSEK